MVVGFHPELRHRTASDDDGVSHKTRLNEGRRVYERVHRRRAERLHVDAGGIHAARHLGDGLGEIASTAIVAISHRLLGATDDVLYYVRSDALLHEKPAESVCAAGLRRQIFQKNTGIERFVGIMIAANAPDEAFILKKRQGLSSLDAPGNVFLTMFLWGFFCFEKCGGGFRT